MQREQGNNPRRRPTQQKKPAQGTGKQRRQHLFVTIVTRICTVLLLLIPTYLAIIGYIWVKNQPVEITETLYTSMDLQGPSGETLSVMAGDPNPEKQKLLDCFEKMLTGATYTPGVSTETHSCEYLVTMHSNTGDSTYRFYFSPTDNTAFYKDSSGTSYRTKDGSASDFVNSPFSFELYSAAVPPVLTSAATDEIIPTELSWHYLTEDGTFTKLTKTNIATSLITYPIANDIAFTLSIPPSSASKIFIYRDGESTPLYEGKVSADTTVSLDQGKVEKGEFLRFEIRLFYNQDSNLPYYGELSYNFRMEVVDAAEFSVDKQTSVAGGFFLLSCRNVNNAQKLEFTLATPTGNIQLTPIIFRRNGVVYAAIPADHVGANTLTVEYGTVSGSFDLNVTAPDTTEHTPAPEDLRGSWQLALSGGLDDLIRQYGADADSGIATPQQTLILPTAPQKLAFGDTISGIGTLPFALYTGLDTVGAMQYGRVLTVGSNELLGNFVILDHGCGLYTWYAGLSYIRVREGQILSAGETVGTAGESGLGLAGERSAMLMATIGKDAISPEYLSQHAFDFSK